MKIAIIGWGSLIWDPRNLQIDKLFGNKGWSDNGPKLPIEFARISSNSRLTLVIFPGKDEIKTLFSILNYEQLDEAILDLALREDCGKNKIGCYIKNNQEFSENLTQEKFNKLKEEIISWTKIEENKDIDAVIWTNLAANFKDKIGLELTEINAINYLKYLPLDARVKAEEYIRKTPKIIDTPIRRAIEEELKWSFIDYLQKENDG